MFLDLFCLRTPREIRDYSTQSMVSLGTKSQSGAKSTRISIRLSIRSFSIINYHLAITVLGTIKQSSTIHNLSGIIAITPAVGKIPQHLDSTHRIIRLKQKEEEEEEATRHKRKELSITVSRDSFLIDQAKLNSSQECITPANMNRKGSTRV